LQTDADDRRYCGIHYSDRYEYFDTVYFQSERLISAEDQWWLEDHCDRLDILQDGQVIGGRTVKVFYPYRFQIEVHRPDRKGLEYLARIDIKLTAVHIARDFTFDDSNGKGALLDFVSKHWVQPHQRKTRRVARFDNGQDDNGGGSTGRRGKGHYETYYASEACRIDGVVDCFHSEGRHHGKIALQHIGIDHKFKLLDFDFTEYWRKKDRTSFKGIDIQRLGQYHSNRQRGSRNRKSDRDWRIGSVLIRKHAFDWLGNICVQQFIQKYGSGPFLRNADELGLSEENIQIGGIDIQGDQS